MSALEPTMDTQGTRFSGRSARPVHVIAAVLLAAPLAHAQEQAQQQAGQEPPPAPAQQSSGQLEELVVTAPKYVSSGSLSAMKSDTPLVEIPQSVTVISRDQIDLLNWSSVQQSVRYTAGITGENFGPDERYDWLTLRGFTPVQFVDGLQAPIGATPPNTGIDLYGFESVDILKGPSSVLYGLTPPGGIVNVRSRRPSEEFGGELGLEYGNRDYKTATGDVTGAITDWMNGRLTGLWRDHDQQIDHADFERTYIAPALTFELGSDTQLTLLYYYQKDKVNGETNGFLPAYGVALPNPLGKVPTSRNLGEPDYNKYERDQWGAGYDFSHSFSENLTLSQNLKFFHQDSQMLVVYGAGLLDANFDGVPDDYRTVLRNNFPFDEDVDAFAVDTRIEGKFDTGPLAHTLLAGIDYRDYDNNQSFGFAGWFSDPPYTVPSIDLFNPVYGAPIVTPPMSPFVDQEQKQTGYYLQDQIKLDRLIFTLSGRQDEVKADNFGTDTDDSEFTYRAGINYVFENGFAPYVQYATSFQPTYGADFFGNPFEPTTGEQIEGGIKWDGRSLAEGNRLFATLAAYKIKQDKVLVPDPDPNHPFFQVQTGEVDVDGVELEVVGRFQERLSFNASYTYTNTDPELVMVAEQKISGLVDYTFQDGVLAGLGAGVGVRYLADRHYSPFDNESLTLWDAILHYDTRAWRVAVNASNLGDKTYVAQCRSTVDCFYGARRQVIGSVTYKF
jgi:iron complex outermembrane receptor protein